MLMNPTKPGAQQKNKIRGNIKIPDVEAKPLVEVYLNVCIFNACLVKQ